MTAQFARPQQRGRSGIGQAHEPHAALLIDFDNVTMGIRSDLTKELKNLLNSDIIKGKVAVQRAYADWRRYPQYIVPLAESSVDLIFAPAYGSAKKNATDIRLAIDAIELVFTRPEIGTIILLSGDSDFSSMVLKLKEYGKYVIGVGIRESASDLLVQNCDEYYSYSALTGLTRAGDEAPAVSEDPWELVEMALRQMRENDDVMRSDRLKQVLLELDPSFDEKALGFQKFNKFLQEAASRGLLSLRKQDNGQFELGPADAAPATETPAEARGEPRRARGRRGRGRREEARREDGREPRREALAPTTLPAPAAGAVVDGPQAQPETVAPSLAPEPVRAAAAKPAAEPTKPVAETAKPAAEAARPLPEPVAKRPEPVAKRPEPVRERPERARPAEPAAEPKPTAAEADRRQVAAEATAPEAARPGRVAKPGAGADLAASYDLLRRAATDLVKKSGQAARDSDVKRRMLELEAGWDESALGFSKFSRFLRQAHDAEVITLRKDENGVYDVQPGDGEAGRTEEPAPERERERGRGRAGRGRGERDRAPDGVRTTAAAAPAPAPAATVPDGAPAAVVRPPLTPREAPAAAAGEKKAAQPAALLFRRGSRGRAPSGPPPLLEGQTAAVRLPIPKPVLEPVHPQPTPAPAADLTRDRPAEAASESIAAALGLPQQPDEVASYIAANYRGVGPKSVQALIDEFGPTRVFDALEKLPDRVRDLLGAGRGHRLLAAFQEDVRRRRGQAEAVPAPARAGAGTQTKRPAKAAGRGAGTRAAKRPAAAAPAPDEPEPAATAASRPAVQTTAPAAKQSGRGRKGRGSRRGRSSAQ